MNAAALYAGMTTETIMLRSSTDAGPRGHQSQALLQRGRRHTELRFHPGRHETGVTRTWRDVRKERARDRTNARRVELEDPCNHPREVVPAYHVAPREVDDSVDAVRKNGPDRPRGVDVVQRVLV